MIGEPLTPVLRRTLAAVAHAFAGADDPWWIISRAAVALHGVGPIEAGDVDVLASARDARGLLVEQDIEPAEGAEHPLFRSEVFGGWRANPLPVEIMARFRVRRDGRWMGVHPRTCKPVELDSQRLFITSSIELTGMLRSLDRPTDFKRTVLPVGLPSCAPGTSARSQGWKDK